MKKITLMMVLTILGLFTKAQTTLQAGFCNYTSKSFGEVIYANTVGGVTNYRFKFINAATSYTQVWTNPGACACTALYAVPGITTGLTYSVSVATTTDNGATWSGYGSPCDLTSPSDYTTAIIPSDCGVTAGNWNQIYNCYPAGDPPTQQYEFRLINASLSYTQTFVKYNQNIIFSQFTGLGNSTTYTVDIRVYYNNVWQNYGPSCSITTPPAPTTSLTPTDCNSTPATWSSLIHAETNIGDSIAYRLVNSALSYTQTFKKTNFNFILTQFTGLQNSTTYTCDCSIRYNGTFGPYGNACTITTPAAPTSSLQPSDCNITATSYTNQLLHAESVTGFQCYFYNFTDGVNTYTLEKCNNNNFNLSQLTPTLPVGTTYSVTVKVKFNNIYGPFSNTCAVTTPAVYQRPAVQSFPNPFIESTEINIYDYKKSNNIINSLDKKNSDVTIIKVYDKIGRNIETIHISENMPMVKFGADYDHGIYNVLIINNGQISNLKVVKQ